MDKDIAFLMELVCPSELCIISTTSWSSQGASKAQAQEALRRSKDLMQAAEKYTSGDFDNILDDIYQEPVKSLGRSRLPVCIFNPTYPQTIANTIVVNITGLQILW